MNWTGKHWTIFGLFLGGLGTAVSGLASWQDALTPSFIGGVILQIAAVVAAIHTNKPETGAGGGINPTRFATMLVVGVVVSALALAGCGPKTRPTLIKADATVYTAIKAISDTEIVLSQAGKLSPAQSLRINQALLPAARLGLEATQALKAWKPGTMAPPQVRKLVVELGDVTRVVIATVADGSTQAQLLEKVALAQQAVLVVLTLSGGF